MNPVPDLQLVEDFAVAASQGVGDECLLVVLRPWSTGDPPPGVLAPGGEAGTLDEETITQAAAQKTVVLVPCTFATVEEQEGAARVLPQFSSAEHVCVIMAQLLQPDLELDQETNDVIMRRYDALVAMGVDEVLLDPKPEPASLRRVVSISRAVWELNARRMQLMLDAEPENATEDEVESLQARHRRLLWEGIPPVLMPHFAKLDRNLTETSHTLDQYRLVRRLDTKGGNVLLAVGERNATRIIKVIDKDKLMTPGELEGIYREFRFLSEIVRHPNVVRCLGMLHSPSRVYLIFEYAGNQNLSQLLVASPGQRLDEVEALECFDQIARGLAYCHSKDVAHRNVSMDNVVVLRASSNDIYTFRLVDFYSAMVARNDVTSMTICGGLPCIAPEMALGRPYIPRLADCWSLGIVLLEVGGGKGTLSNCLPYDPDHAENAIIASMVENFFSAEGGHAAALSFMGAVRNQDILNLLVRLVQPEPPQRTELRHLVRVD